jgi:predicted DNA-binding helix-hairpin-helix protein
MRIEGKLAILADAAKYDVSCASSGSRRNDVRGRLGNTAPSGICHTFTEDGRCVSLLKILYTNVYYRAVNIAQRNNRALHLRQLPRRYWQYLPEETYCRKVSRT